MNDLPLDGKGQFGRQFFLPAPTQQVEVAEIERMKAGDFLFSDSGQLAFHAVTLDRLGDGRRGHATVPLLGKSHHNIRFGVALAQTVQADRPLCAGGLDRSVFPIGAAPHLVAVSSQEHEKGIVGVGLVDDGVNVGADHAAHGGLAALLCLPLGVMLALALRGDDG